MAQGGWTGLAYDPNAGAMYADKAKPGDVGAVQGADGNWYVSQAAADAANQRGQQQTQNQTDTYNSWVGAGHPSVAGSPMNPTGAPTQYATNNPTTPATLGALAGGVTPGGSNRPGQPGYAGGFPAPTGGGGDFIGGSTTNPAIPGTTGITGNPMNSFINPMASYMQDWANKGLQSSYAGAGDFLSGPAARGIADYNQKSALNNAWQPAFGDYMANQQQQHQFAQEDQTIPFNQQLQLAQLGLGGAQGAGSLSSALSAILSGNLSNLGQVQGTGTIGTSNSITSALNQFLANLMSQNTLNQVLPQRP